MAAHPVSAFDDELGMVADDPEVIEHLGAAIERLERAEPQWQRWSVLRAVAAPGAGHAAASSSRVHAPARSLLLLLDGRVAAALLRLTARIGIVNRGNAG